MSHYRRYLGLTICLLGLRPVCAAEYWFDAINGHDDTGDGSQSAPWQSWSKALSELEGGDTGYFFSGSYGDVREVDTQNIDLFTDWVTLKAVDGHDPYFESFALLSTESRKLHLILDGIDIRNGLEVIGNGYFELRNQTTEIAPPWVGSEEAIGKEAMWIRGASNIVLDGVEVTRTAIGITLYQTSDVTIKNSTIHDITHDGIRLVGTQNTLVEGNHIYGLNDGVTDAEASWSKHCDAIHIFIAGAPSAEALIPNNGVTIRNNLLHDVEAQLIQFNNISSFNEPENWNQNILFENNVFGPSVAPMAFNNADPANGLVVRHNVFLQYESHYTSPYPELENPTIVSSSASFRTSPSTIGLRVYNNVFHSEPLIAGVAELADFNIIQQPSAQAILPRFTFVHSAEELFRLNTPLDVYPLSQSPGIDQGHPESTGESDPVLTIRDNRPDIGVYEVPNRQPPPLSPPLPPEQIGTVFRYEDDFEDGNLEIDPYLAQPHVSGIVWESINPERPYGIEVYDETLENVLHGPTNSSQGPSIILASNVEMSPWISVELDVANRHVSNLSGPMFLYLDADNFFYFDMGRESGRLVQHLNGIETTLLDDVNLRVPTGETKHLAFEVSATSNALIISYQIDSFETKVYQSSDSNVIATFAQGGNLGFYDNHAVDHLRMVFDNIRVTVAKIPHRPTGFRVR